jgi:23S rRNA (cytidine2498-2'-O)-methyltransferase
VSLPERTAYLAAEGFAAELMHELGEIEFAHDRLLVAAGPPRPAAWAPNIWLDPVEIAIASIGDAARKLRAIQRNWAVYAPRLHRRATLIQAQLPVVSAKPLAFGTPAPAAPLGSWTLLDPNTVLAAPHCTSPFPNGEMRFVEDRTGPPSRAYLKLWEALTVIGGRPAPGETCLDLGSSPGAAGAGPWRRWVRASSASTRRRSRPI